jgi:hypothetical protein
MLWNENECGKTESNENVKATILIRDTDELKTTGECGMFFNGLGSMMTNNARVACEIKYKIFMAEAAFN